MTSDEIKNHPLFHDLKPHIVDQFCHFYAQNPHIYELYERFSLQLIQAGRTRYGIAAITERIRWHLAVETNGDDFKLNDHYRSCYARLLMATDDRFNGFFEIRSHKD